MGWPPIGERDFQKQVIGLGRICGWHVLHWRAARTLHGWRTPIQGDGAGFPDTLFVRERLVLAELKVRPNKLSPEQEQWQQWLRDAGCESYVWYPEQWDEIERVLGLRRAPL